MESVYCASTALIMLFVGVIMMIYGTLYMLQAFPFMPSNLANRFINWVGNTIIILAAKVFRFSSKLASRIIFRQKKKKRKRKKTKN